MMDHDFNHVRDERVKRALQRERHSLESGNSGRERHPLVGDEPAPQYLTRVKIKSADRILFLKVEQIDWVEAADNYVIFHAGQQNYIVREKLSALEALLNPEHFFRIGRSTLVNVARISELRTMFKGEHVVVLNDGARLPMTRGI